MMLLVYGNNPAPDMAKAGFLLFATGKDLAPLDQYPNIDQLWPFFDNIVIDREFKGVKVTEKIRKWYGPPRIVVRGYCKIVDNTTDSRQLYCLEAMTLSKQNHGYATNTSIDS